MIPPTCPDAFVAKLEEARQLITDMMRVINGRMGPMDCPAYDVARRLIGARVNALFALPVSPETPVRMIGSPLRSPASVAADKIAELDVALGVMTQRHDKAMEISEVHARTIERLLRRESELIEKRDRIAGEKADLKAKVAKLETSVTNLIIDPVRQENDRLRARVDELERNIAAMGRSGMSEASAYNAGR